MKVHVLQHLSFEGIGSMERWLRERNAVISATHFYDDTTLPDPAGFDLIIVMGGPMSANDEAKLPWLAEEKRFLREAIGQGVPVLGVCLGAQLLASALGARVYRGPAPEIGWFEIESTSSDAACFRFPEHMTVFHWHGETFDLPEGAVRLASSAAYPNQAYQVGRNAIGLQCHLETTPEFIQQAMDYCGNELVEGPSVQSADLIRAAEPERYVAANAVLDDVLEYLTRGTE